MTQTLARYKTKLILPQKVLVKISTFIEELYFVNKLKHIKMGRVPLGFRKFIESKVQIGSTS